MKFLDISLKHKANPHNINDKINRFPALLNNSGAVDKKTDKFDIKLLPKTSSITVLTIIAGKVKKAANIQISVLNNTRNNSLLVPKYNKYIPHRGTFIPIKNTAKLFICSTKKVLFKLLLMIYILNFQENFFFRKRINL